VNPRNPHELPRTAGPLGLAVTSVHEGLVVGSIGPVGFAIWRSKPTRELFEVQRRELAALVANDPGNVAFLCVVEANAEPPDQEVRDASSSMISAHGKNLRACACVIEGSGFRAAITRTVLAGIALVARNKTPTRFFETVPVAADWLCELVAVGQESTLSAQVEVARKRLDTAATWR
jgi:hypothetical protein